MQHIQNVAEVGKGIAVAFVATIYGVGIANVILIPAAGKIRARTHAAIEMRELMLEGVCGIVEGLNPKLIRVKLEAFVESKPKAGPKVAKSETAKAA
jgi:chemotaxis protein MotA